ncbi:MAG: enoyl-CoA hydratase, partial [Gammaproteobacteria bacterium]|nr:enoyl-CoA hydratase [Gammaproteobacteria bacterium]
MSYNNIIYEKDERLAFITLNRPEKLNPLSHALRGEVYDALRDAEADTEIGVI